MYFLFCKIIIVALKVPFSDYRLPFSYVYLFTRRHLSINDQIMCLPWQFKVVFQFTNIRICVLDTHICPFPLHIVACYLCTYVFQEGQKPNKTLSTVNFLRNLQKLVESSFFFHINFLLKKYVNFHGVITVIKKRPKSKWDDLKSKLHIIVREVW